MAPGFLDSPSTKSIASVESGGNLTIVHHQVDEEKGQQQQQQQQQIQQKQQLEPQLLPPRSASAPLLQSPRTHAATALLDSLASGDQGQQDQGHQLSPIEKLAARSSVTSTTVAAAETPEDQAEIQRTIQEVRRYMRAFRED